MHGYAEKLSNHTRRYAKKLSNHSLHKRYHAWSRMKVDNCSIRTDCRIRFWFTVCSVLRHSVSRKQRSFWSYWSCTAVLHKSLVTESGISRRLTHLFARLQTVRPSEIKTVSREPAFPAPQKTPLAVEILQTKFNIALSPWRQIFMCTQQFFLGYFARLKSFFAS